MNALFEQWMNEMGELVDYCARFDPEFSRRIVGADERDLQRVAEAAGRPLAPEHRAFLNRMGRTPHNSLGGFLDDVEYGVDATLRFYAAPPVPSPPDALYVWTQGADCEMFLGLEEKNGARPLVMFSWPVDPETGRFTSESRLEHIVADSLFQFLYQEAVLRIRTSSLRHRAQLREKNATKSADEAMRRQFRARFKFVATKLGFHQVPYVDGNPIFYERADAVLTLYTAEVARDTVDVYAEDSREFAKLCAIVSDNLEVDRWS